MNWSLFDKVDHLCNINENCFQFISKWFWNLHLSVKKTVCWDYIRVFLFYMRSKTLYRTKHWWSTISTDANTIPPGETSYFQVWGHNIEYIFFYACLRQLFATQEHNKYLNDFYSKKFAYTFTKFSPNILGTCVYLLHIKFSNFFFTVN